MITVSGYIGIQLGNLSFKTAPHEFNSWYVYLQVFGMNFNSIWGVMVPLFAALPFGDTLIYDLNHGFEVPLIMRCGMKRYFFTKWLANIIVIACVSCAVLSCSLIMALLWRRDIKMPTIMSATDSPFSGVYLSSYQPHVLNGLFWTHPAVYSLIPIVIGVLVCISIGSITMVASLFSKKRYLILAAPFIFYMLFNVAVQVIGLYLWVPFVMSAGFLEFQYSILPTIFYWSPILLFSWIATHFGPNRYREFKLALSNSSDSND